MGRKIRNTIWLILLLALSFPVGYIYQVVYNNMLVYSEKMLNLIVGGVALILVLGVISLIVFRVLKKRSRSKDPAKMALLVYSLILIIILLSSVPFFEDANQKHLIEQFVESNSNY